MHMPFAEKKLLKQFGPKDGLFNYSSDGDSGFGPAGTQPGSASSKNGTGKVPLGRQAGFQFDKDIRILVSHFVFKNSSEKVEWVNSPKFLHQPGFFFPVTFSGLHISIPILISFFSQLTHQQEKNFGFFPLEKEKNNIFFHIAVSAENVHEI